MIFLNLVAKRSKNLFLKWQYQNLNIPGIEKCNLSVILDFTPFPIQNKCENKQFKCLLSTSSFWQALNEATGFSEESVILKSQWESAKEFADFSTQELMHLKRNNFDSYEVIILQALGELRNDLKRYELNGIWRPKWMLSWHQERINELQDKYDTFLEIKKKLQFDLQLRTRFYIDLGVSKHIDDIYLYFFTKVNQLSNVLPPELKPIQISSFLDDDTRLAIYDFLISDVVYAQDTLEYIITPITQAPYRTPIKVQQVEKELTNINIFSARIKNNLQLTAREKYKKEKHMFENENSWIGKWIVSPLSYIMNPSGAMDRIKMIWRYRWFLTLVASLGIYFWLASAAVTFIGLLVGMWAASIVSNVLFYGLALLPAYIIGFKILKHAGDTLYSALGYWKMQEIFQALELLKLNQRFITAQLSNGIRDIALFNIAPLKESSQSAIENINKMMTLLEMVKGSAWLVHWGAMKESTQEIVSELMQQKRMINVRLKIYAEHISERLSERLVTFHEDIINGELNPTIPKKQIQSLYRFVEKYGGSKALGKFTRSTDLVGLFMTELSGNDLLFRMHNSTTLAQPWGGFKSNQPSFNGWRILIRHYEMNENRQAAALKIIDILTGKSNCNLSALTQWANIVAGTNSEKVMRNIQQHIFLTLDCRVAVHVNLLTNEQKNLLTSWGDRYQAVLDSASKFVSDLHENTDMLNYTDTNTLVKYFEALDGLERFNAVSEPGALVQKNPIRSILEKYNGSSSKLVYFLKFLPDHLRAEKTIDMFSKRLHWLIENFNLSIDGGLDEADIELFKEPSFLGDFSFGEIVRDHKKYTQPWAENFHQFLVMCGEYGLDDGVLLEKYELLNTRSQKFIGSFGEAFVLSAANKTYHKGCKSDAHDNIEPVVVRGVRCA